MPIVALALNLCWESLYAYVYLNRNIADIQACITIGLRKETIERIYITGFMKKNILLRFGRIIS